MTATIVLTATRDARSATPPVLARPARPTGPEGPAGRRPGASRGGERTRPGDSARVRPAHVPRSTHRTRRPGVVDPQALARTVAHLYLEVECGRRPARQLAALMDPELHARLEPGWVRLHQPLGRIRHVQATLRGGRIHAVAVVQRGPRAGALALELSSVDGRWYVTAAVRPEDGPLPPPPYARLAAPEPLGDDLDEVAGLGLPEHVDACDCDFDPAVALSAGVA